MLLQAPFPPDIRLEKEISALLKNNYKVTLLCNQYDKTKDKNFLSCNIVRVKALFNNLNLNKILNFPLFLNPRYIFYVLKTYYSTKPDYIHVHDLPMVPLGLMLKFFFNKIVIFDMHENYPEALKVFEKKGLSNFIFKNYKLAKKLEKFCIKRTDKIISVIEENNDRLLSLGIDKNKLHIVSNTVDLNTFNVNSTISIELNQYKDKYTILYSGTVSPERGLLTPIKAITSIIEVIPNLKMIIIGDGVSVEILKQLAKQNNIDDYIDFIAWVGHEKIINYINIASICMIPQPSNAFIDTTIPHKLFEYMSLEKTVLVSDAKPLRRIVTETKAGLVFKSENPKDFADKVIEIYQSDYDYGQNGRKAVEEKYNWSTEEKKLLDLYRKLV